MSKTTFALRVASFAVPLVLPLAACDQFPSDQQGSSSSSGSLGEGGSSTTAAGLQSIDTTTLCARLIDQCGQGLTPGSCHQNYDALRVTAACNTALASASCADLQSSTSAVTATCFPPCSGTIARCNGDGTLSLCSVSGTTQVADCRASCVAEGYTAWTGVCDSTYQGQVSDHPQCWCQ